MYPGRETHACAVCSEKVPREFVHRNRAGAYICHVCRAERNHAGMLERGWKRLLRRLHWIGRPLLYVGSSLALALVVAYLIVQLFS
ncbi:MAG: hypothetical protein HZB40_08740 [Rhodocyclales bacterium]|nr:hypothetical protein [Rhodocyclales bacterium]